MADYATLKAAIQAVIYENGNQEITGSVMQATLLAMVNSLGANYQYAGIATPSTNPGTPDQNVFYLASTAGTYVNFGNIVLAENEVAILKYNGSWTKDSTGLASAEQLDKKTVIKNDLTGGIIWTDSKYIDYRNGIVTDSSFASITSYIDISMAAGGILWYSRLCNTYNGYQGMAFYDENKVYISGVAPIVRAPEIGIVLDFVAVPATAKFACFSCPTANKASFELFFNVPINEKISVLEQEIETTTADLKDINDSLAEIVWTELAVDWISGQYYNSAKAIKSNANYSRAVIDLSNIDGITEAELNLHSESAQIYIFLEDASHSTLWSQEINNSTVYPLMVQIPSNAAFLLLSNKSANGAGKVYVNTLGDTDWIRPALNTLLDKTPEVFLKGKKISFLGDSMTYGSGATSTNKRYSTLFSNRCGAIENNLGVAGSALATNAVGRSDSTRFAARATVANLEGSDLIIIFGGTNDFSYDSKAIGDLFVETSITPTERIGSKELTAPSDTDTFAGALHELINLVRTNCPNVPIMFMTPINRGSYTSIAGRPTSKQSNVNGNFLYEFVDAIKKICAFYSIPVLDLSGSELDFSNAAIAADLSSDNLHPNDKGYAIIAELLYRFVEQNIIVR